jgi:hypothetical protein
MRKPIPISIVAVSLSSLSATALADHNSRWGEGWAKMPNDIHNTRIETRGDDDTFRDFVRFGNGADSVNRFSSNDRAAVRSASKQKSRAAGTRRQSGAGRQRAGGRRR